MPNVNPTSNARSSSRHHRVSYDENTSPMDFHNMLGERDRRAYRLGFRTVRTKFRLKNAK